MQIGVALSLPGLVSLLVEPAVGVLGDRGHRRRLIVGGGLAFALALISFAASTSFVLLVAASALLYPASGAFVSLSQATLMDSAPRERARNMTRWTIAGSVGVLAGPLLVAAGLGWRVLFIVYAVATLVVVVVLRRQPIAETRASVGDLLHALRGSGALRWLLLLEVQDLGGDVLFGFLALYLVDTGGLSAATAALGVAVWAGADLAGNAVLLWLLPRIDTLRWLRVSAAAVAVLFVCFQLTPAPVSLVLLALVAGLRAGWYPISQARLYDALPGQSGTAMALSTMASVIGLALPLALGALAAHVGLHDAFWVILIAPLALLLCVPSSECASRSSSSTSTEPSSTPAGSSSPR